MQRGLRRWYSPRVYVVVDTTSVAGRLCFVRVEIAHAGHAIPLSWPRYGDSNDLHVLSDDPPVLR